MCCCLSSAFESDLSGPRALRARRGWLCGGRRARSDAPDLDMNLESAVDVNHETHELHENTARKCKSPLSDDLTRRVADRHGDRRAYFRVILCISWFQLLFSG